MGKVDVSLNGFSYPMPCALVGVNVEGKPNYLTVAWFSMVHYKPSYRYRSRQNSFHKSWYQGKWLLKYQYTFR